MADIGEILSGKAAAPVSDENEVIKDEANAAEAEAEATVSDEKPEAEDDAETGQKMVPVAALQAERQKAKRYTEQVADFQKELQELRQQNQQFQQMFMQKQQEQQKPQAPDFWENPETATEYRVQQTVAPLEQRVAMAEERALRAEAVIIHGRDTVDAAFKAMQEKYNPNDPYISGAYQKIMASEQPYSALVDWHKQEQLRADMADPVAYEAKLVEKIEAKIRAEMQQGQRPSSPAASVMPSNFAATRNVGSRTAPDWDGPTPLSDILSTR